MSKRTNHKTTQPVEIWLNGKSIEIEAAIAFSYYPGCPATPPSYSHGGLPPDPSEIEIESIALTMNGEAIELPKPLADWIEQNVDQEQLEQHACDDAGPDPDEEREERRAERLLDDEYNKSRDGYIEEDFY